MFFIRSIFIINLKWEYMKNNLAENMLRFGAKNLTNSSKRILEQLAVGAKKPAASPATTTPTQSVTAKVAFTSAPMNGVRVTKPTMQFSSTRDKAPILHLMGKADGNSDMVAISKDALIIPGRPVVPHYSYNQLNFLYSAATELFGGTRGQDNIFETLLALRNVKSNLAQLPEGGIIVGTINNMLKIYKTYATMPYPVFMYEINEIKATDVGNDPGPWHVGARKFFDLPTEDYIKYSRDGNYRQMVFNNWYRKNPTTPPPKPSPGEKTSPGDKTSQTSPETTKPVPAPPPTAKK
jgi:hypothetical protein